MQFSLGRSRAALCDGRAAAAPGRRCRPGRAALRRELLEQEEGGRGARGAGRAHRRLPLREARLPRGRLARRVLPLGRAGAALRRPHSRAARDAPTARRAGRRDGAGAVPRGAAVLGLVERVPQLRRHERVPAAERAHALQRRPGPAGLPEPPGLQQLGQVPLRDPERPGPAAAADGARRAVVRRADGFAPARIRPARGRTPAHPRSTRRASCRATSATTCSTTTSTSSTRSGS